MSKNTLHYAAMFLKTSQILKYVDFTKTQKSRYLENETFFLQIKKFLSYISRANLKKKSFVVEVTFKPYFFVFQGLYHIYHYFHFVKIMIEKKSTSLW